MVERTIETKAAAREGSLRPLGVREARWLLIVIAAWLGAFDLIVKVVAPTESGFYHQRTHLELLAILIISAAAVYFVPLARSRLITVGAGFMVGGGVGNALSIVVFPLGVPNPFAVSESGWTIAFNLADVCVAIGFVLMTTGVWGLSIRLRQDLRRPVER
jgi:hypothetical protein